MPRKASPIDDITSADQVKPSASSRPIVVSNTSTLASDPMMKPEETSEETSSAPLVSHMGKKIAPLATDAAVEPATSQAEAAVEDSTALDEKTEEKPAEPEASADAAEPDEPESKTKSRDSDAAASAAELEAQAARDARRQELEQLIESGKYAVPINAVQRKRSRMFVAGMCLLAVVLAVLLFDVLLDTGVVKLSAIPHTHFFTS